MQVPVPAVPRLRLPAVSGPILLPRAVTTCSSSPPPPVASIRYRRIITSSSSPPPPSLSSMGEEFSHLPLANTGPLKCPLTGDAVLQSPLYNKGSAFPARERKTLGLEGLLPANVQTLEEQVDRAYQQYQSRPDALAKNTFMASLKEQNQVLYYRVSHPKGPPAATENTDGRGADIHPDQLIQENLKEMFSVIYTPTEGDDSIEPSLSRWGSSDQIDYIVVTDSEEILGIGDQGVGGILISVAKLVLATVCAGVHPGRTLPVVLDCGTDNHSLLHDRLYLGVRKPRVRGKEYDDFVKKFINTSQKLFPRAYLHFEDFGLHNARRLLDKYRSSIACFNDDVQGTGCVTLAAIYAALGVTGTRLEDLRMVVFGSGTAGIGIADQVRDAIAEDAGKSKEEAARQIWCVDKPGLLLKSHGEQLTPAQVNYAREDSEWDGKERGELLSVVKEVKPHVLIGTSTKPKTFTEEVVKEMARHVERPIIFPLSNPTRLHEAEPKDLSAWTDGKALIATGSPFPPVEHGDKKFEIAECNNAIIYPGIALGTILSRSKLVSDKMLVAATKALASQSPALEDPSKGLLSDVVDVRNISIKIAAAVIRQAVEEGLAREKDIPEDNEERLEGWVKAQMWEAKYRDLVRD